MPLNALAIYKTVFLLSLIGSINAMENPSAIVDGSKSNCCTSSKTIELPTWLLSVKALATVRPLKEKALIVYIEHLKKNFKDCTREEYKKFKRFLCDATLDNLGYSLFEGFSCEDLSWADYFCNRWKELVVPVGKERCRPICCGDFIHWDQRMATDMVAFSPDGNFKAEVGNDLSSCSLFEKRDDNFDLKCNLPGSGHNYKVAFSHKGDLLVVGSINNFISIIPTNKPVEEIQKTTIGLAGTCSPADIIFSHNDAFFIVCGGCNSTYLFHNNPPYIYHQLPIEENVNQVVLNPSSTVIGFGHSMSETISLLDLSTRVIKSFDDIGTILSITASNKIIAYRSVFQLAVNDYKKIISIYDFDGNLLKEYESPFSGYSYFMRTIYPTAQAPLCIAEETVITPVTVTNETDTQSYLGIRKLATKFYVPEKKLPWKELYSKLKNEAQKKENDAHELLY